MLKINSHYTELKFKGKRDLLNKYNKLVENSHVMESTLREIKRLKRGKVTPRETKRRSRIGSYFSSEAQQILYYIQQHHLNISEDIPKELMTIISKAEAILRENIVLQTKPPLDVIKFKNVPKRYAHNPTGKKERRSGYGMHKLPTTEQGYSICIAFMPPKHKQMFHNHKVSEYTLALDRKTIGLSDQNGSIKQVTAHKNEILYFSATTPHTLYNPTNFTTRNITVKSPSGIMDWRPVYDLNPVKERFSNIIKGKVSPTKFGAKLSFSVSDKFYNYRLEILELKKGSVIEDVYSTDRYFYVVDGNLTVSSGDIKKCCNKNDYIVIDKNTAFMIKANAKCRLHTVITKL